MKTSPRFSHSHVVNGMRLHQAGRGLDALPAPQCARPAYLKYFSVKIILSKLTDCGPASAQNYFHVWLRAYK